eukprot:3135190-Rhodomonas_salina.4
MAGCSESSMGDDHTLRHFENASKFASDANKFSRWHRPAKPGRIWVVGRVEGANACALAMKRSGITKLIAIMNGGWSGEKVEISRSPWM